MLSVTFILGSDCTKLTHLCSTNFIVVTKVHDTLFSWMHTGICHPIKCYLRSTDPIAKTKVHGTLISCIFTGVCHLILFHQCATNPIMDSKVHSMLECSFLHFQHFCIFICFCTLFQCLHAQHVTPISSMIQKLHVNTSKNIEYHHIQSLQH